MEEEEDEEDEEEDEQDEEDEEQDEEQDEEEDEEDEAEDSNRASGSSSSNAVDIDGILYDGYVSFSKQLTGHLVKHAKCSSGISGDGFVPCTQVGHYSSTSSGSSRSRSSSGSGLLVFRHDHLERRSIPGRGEGYCAAADIPAGTAQPFARPPVLSIDVHP
jgi:hypothetical protein